MPVGIGGSDAMEDVLTRHLAGGGHLYRPGWDDQLSLQDFISFLHDHITATTENAGSQCAIEAEKVVGRANYRVAVLQSYVPVHDLYSDVADILTAHNLTVVVALQLRED